MNCIFCNSKMVLDSSIEFRRCFDCPICKTKHNKTKYTVGLKYKSDEIEWAGIYFDRYAIVQGYVEGTGWLGATTIMEKNTTQGYHDKIVMQQMMDIDLATITEETLELMVLLS